MSAKFIVSVTSNLMQSLNMNIYKIIFAKNAIVDCQVVDRKIKLNSDCLYEHANGNLIYALIKAKNESEAITKSNEIIRDFVKKMEKSN